MIEELAVIVNELYQRRYEAKTKADSYNGYDANFYVVEKYNARADAYTEAIDLLNKLIDKREGVKGE